LLSKEQIKAVFAVGVGLLLYVDLFQNFMPFGSEDRIDFYFTQMAFCQVLFALCLDQLIKNKVSMFFLWYCLGELFNEVFFNGSLNYIEIITGFIALLYIIIFCKNDRGAKQSIK